MAQSGHNGKNESHIGYSYGLDLSFLDENGNEIVIQNIAKPIEMWIPRANNIPYDNYLHVNTSNFTILESQQILPNSLNIASTNASLHIQLKPSNINVAYLFLIKFGSSPKLNSTYSSYDFWNALCPNSTSYYTVNDTIAQQMDSFYLIFLNQAQVNGYRVQIFN